MLFSSSLSAFWPMLALLLLLSAAALLTVGCKSVTAPVGRPAGYPGNWPEISSAALDDQAWQGTYVNWGDWTPRALPPFGGGLTSLLPNSTMTGAQVLSLNIESRPKHFGDLANATLCVGSGEGNGYHEQKYGCIRQKHSLLLIWLHKSTTTRGIPYYSEEYQQNVYLAKGVDGSLIARIQDQQSHVAFIIPWWHIKYSWARFEKME